MIQLIYETTIQKKSLIWKDWKIISVCVHTQCLDRFVKHSTIELYPQIFEILTFQVELICK